MKYKNVIAVIALITAGVMMLSACSKKELVISGENNFSVKDSDTDGKLVVMTYNIKNCQDGEGILDIVSDIKKYNPDVVCVQEVDNGTRRSKKQNILKLLAEELNMNYCFFPAINFRGGLYGIGIMSTFPLENCHMQPLEIREEDEGRVLASADIKTPKKTVHIFNTHLSFENKESRLKQIKYLNDMLKDKDSFVLTGDFNISGFEEYAPLEGMNAVNTANNPFASFIGGDGNDGSFRAIDNIFVSDNLKIGNIIFGQTSVSDHRPLIAEIEL